MTSTPFSSVGTKIRIDKEENVPSFIYFPQSLDAYSPTIPSLSLSRIYRYNQCYIKVIGIHCLILKEPHIIDISKMCDLILISYSTKAPVCLSTILHKLVELFFCKKTESQNQ